MSPATRELITSLINGDATISAPERADILAVVAGKAPAGPARAITMEEAARRLCKTKKTVHLLCNRGVLRRIQPAGWQRAMGIDEASVEAMIKGTK